MTLVPDGRLCACGNRGCWEMYASGRALARDARELVAASPLTVATTCSSWPARSRPSTGRWSPAAAAAGDPAALSICTTMGRWLGRGLANLAAALDPSVFVIGGGVSAAGELLLGPAREEFAHTLTGRGFRPDRARRRRGLRPGRRAGRRSRPGPGHRRGGGGRYGRMTTVPSLRLLSYNVRSMRDDRARAGAGDPPAPSPTSCACRRRRGSCAGARLCAQLARTSGLVVVGGGRPAAAQPDHVHAWASTCRHGERAVHQGLAACTSAAPPSPCCEHRRRRFAVAGTHLDLVPEPRLRHVGELHAAIAAHVPPEVPTIVAGDMNDQPGSPVWTALAERARRRVRCRRRRRRVHVHRGEPAPAHRRHLRRPAHHGAFGRRARRRRRRDRQRSPAVAGRARPAVGRRTPVQALNRPQRCVRRASQRSSGSGRAARPRCRRRAAPRTACGPVRRPAGGPGTPRCSSSLNSSRSVPVSRHHSTNTVLGSVGRRRYIVITSACEGAGAVVASATVDPA